MTVAIALDTSGSIRKEEFDKARELAAAVLHNLPAGSDAGLFTFDDQERLLLPWGSNAAEIRQALSIVARTGKFTAMHDALYEASRKLQAAPPGRKALLLITDGKDEGSTLNLEDGLRVAQDSRIPVWVVGMGRVQEKVLRRVAKLTSGEYIPLASASASTLAAKIASAPPAPGLMASGPGALGSGQPSDSAAAVGSNAGAPSGSTTGAGQSGRTAGTASRASSSSDTAAPRGRGFGFWIAIAGGVLTCFGLGVVFLRRRAAHRCATCGFELAGALSGCTYCSAENNARIAQGAGSSSAKAERSPSVSGRVGTDTLRRDKSPITSLDLAGAYAGASAASSTRVAAEASAAGAAHGANGVNGASKGLSAHVAPDASVLSETVLARMNATEEYLEKTVTLREKPVLVITGGPGSGRVFSLSHEMTTCVGRAKLNDIVLEDISVSSEHCRIRPEDGGFVVHDLKSTNGTYVNAKKVATHPLNAGDVIQIGETSMLFRMDHQRAS